jgi:hypothetical protein
MAQIFLAIMLLVGGLLVAGATGNLVAAGRYELLFGPGELAKAIFSVGDLVDDQMALQSALVREYGVTTSAQSIQILEERYNAANPVTMPTRSSNINIPINNHNPRDGVAARGRPLREFYPIM